MGQVKPTGLRRSRALTRRQMIKVLTLVGIGAVASPFC